MSERSEMETTIRGDRLRLNYSQAFTVAATQSFRAAAGPPKIDLSQPNLPSRGPRKSDQP
jgi:hypothetical protein